MMTSSSTFDAAAVAAAFVTAEAADKQSLSEKLALNAAINAIFNQPPVLAGGCSIYLIDESWHMEEALLDGRFDVLDSVAAIESFLNQQDRDSAIVSGKAGVSLAQLEALVSNGAYSKILLLDATAKA